MKYVALCIVLISSAIFAQDLAASNNQVRLKPFQARRIGGQQLRSAAQVGRANQLGLNQPRASSCVRSAPLSQPQVRQTIILQTTTR